MSVTRIATDNPKTDQWKLLGQFAYPTNIRNYLKEKSLPEDADTVDFIAGCIRQSEAYFTAAVPAPLDISPLLLYYGATNLLAGISALLSGAKPPIEHHGMYPDKSTINAPRIADFHIGMSGSATGALQNFCTVFSAGCVMSNTGTWSVGEILGSVPDLVQEYENCYRGTLPYVIPVKVTRAEMHGIRFLYERIAMSDLAKFPDPQTAIDLIADLKSAYLTPRYNIPSEFVPLYYKQEGTEIGTHSIFGKKFLQLAHVKNGKLISPSQLIIMLMGLYALGFLSRYYPERWNPFVRTDNTGERLVIEKFLEVCQRYLPNLVLNRVTGSRIQFVYETETMLDLVNPFKDTPE